MIYVDASIVLAQLLVEDRRPPPTLWSDQLVSSRLVEYEAWVRVNARGLADSHGDELRTLLQRIELLELSPLVLERAIEPFPLALRTLDALHLASIDYLRAQRIDISLATFDTRMSRAAEALAIPLESLDP